MCQAFDGCHSIGLLEIAYKSGLKRLESSLQDIPIVVLIIEELKNPPSRRLLRFRHAVQLIQLCLHDGIFSLLVQNVSAADDA
jgi:hypothetical protein